MVRGRGGHADAALTKDHGFEWTLLSLHKLSERGGFMQKGLTTSVWLGTTESCVT